MKPKRHSAHRSLLFRQLFAGLAGFALLAGLTVGTVPARPAKANIFQPAPANPLQPTPGPAQAAGTTTGSGSGGGSAASDATTDPCKYLGIEAGVLNCLASSGSSNPLEQQAYLLRQITSVAQAGMLFTHGLPYGSDPKSGGTNGGISTVNVHIHFAGSDGFKHRFNTADRFQKVEGNPWLEWSDGDGNVGGSEELPPNTSSKNSVRFVMTGYNIRTGDPGVVQDVTQNSSGIVYIFRNEYNPKLVVMLWSRNGNATSGLPGVPDGGNDDNRLVFSASCSAVTDPTLEAANIDPNISGTDRNTYFPDTPDALKITAEKYDYKALPGDTCTANTGFLAAAMQWVTEGLDTLIGVVVGWVTGIVDIGTLSNNPGLTSAWKTLRDFVDLIFILILVVIAFSNILRVDTEKYGVRALLPRLVFAVIAVNFSFLMVQIMTNVAYIVSTPFLHSAIQLITNPPADGSLINPSGGFGDFIVAVLLLIGIVIGLLVLLFFFVIRILMIWLLAATSPFVFLFMVLPLTRSLASTWFRNAVKWIFMAPVAFVLLFIAAEVISGGGDLAKNQNGDMSDPSFLLKIGFFIGACIAAVMIPLELGGRVMGAASRGAKRTPGAARSAGSRALGMTSTGRAAKQFVEQRKANQEQAARLRATAAQGAISKRLPGRFGEMVTGGSPGEVGAQQAALENKYAKDINEMGLGAVEQWQIASGQADKLTNPAAANLARSKVGQRAAGRLLANQGLLTRERLEGMKPEERQNQLTAGNQTYMRQYDPVLAAQNGEGQWTSQSIEGIGAMIGSVDPGTTKHMYWSSMRGSADHGLSEGERQAGKTAFGSISTVNAKDNIDFGNRRNLISDDHERDAFVRGVLEHGKDDAKLTLVKQLNTNKQKHGQDISGYQRLIENAGLGHEIE